MLHAHRFAVMLAVIAACHAAPAQVVITGRVGHPRVAGSSETLPLSRILVAASRDDANSQSLVFRTWETEPAGWFRLSGGAGRYTVVASTPAHFMRPLVLTNLFLSAGESFDRRLAPRFDFFQFDDGAWDKQAASDYYQTFVARGKSLTHVGFRLAHDGVDGIGPGSQTLLVDIRRRAAGTPDAWPTVGPAVPVVEVDAGGPKNAIWSAGWNSGEVPLVPGETYAVHIRAEEAGRTFQPFWRADQDAAADCFRAGGKGPTGFAGHDLWMAVGTDGDGLVIPYAKRVHKEFGELTNCIARWSQTYVAKGRSLAAVTLYSAVSGAQPPLARQRARLRVRRGGPEGPQVGAEKIAVGNGNYTGDASWGVFMTSLAPGEVPLVPGETYAIEFESIETYETLHGFVNIKGEVSNDRPGFNPYKKHPRDSYDAGTAWRHGRERVDFDLDMQVVEYEHAADDWRTAVDAANLLVGGDMDQPQAWRPFKTSADTECADRLEPPDNTNRHLRISGPAEKGKKIDGGFVQRVDGLSTAETYRLAGRVRASFPADDMRQSLVGCDPTGQTDDPRAASIEWTVLPGVHGLFIDHAGAPIRPRKDSISVWLWARAKTSDEARFTADFDDFALRRVRTDAPDGR